MNARSDAESGDGVPNELLSPAGLGPSARLAVAAQSLDGGGPVAVRVRADEPFVAASVMKVHILVALLLRVRGEWGGPAREVTAQERAWAAAMIERSDNEAANALWRAAGGAEGIAAAGRLLGLTRTRPAEDGRWGLSTTTAADQLALLCAVHGSGPRRDVLAPPVRRWVRELMRGVVPSQRWGVTAAGDEHVEAPGVASGEVKNGWLPRTATGLWVINSVGRITAAGRPWLLAVLSDGHATAEEGIAAVEGAARAAVRTLMDRRAALAPRPGRSPEGRRGSAAGAGSAG
ncbi:serine hydrolase [Streptomyces sp. 3N207]|uniref:serine hydrolase n=1 Tax=Streptomyces sp. 3N207 TaxID=3457417 RepID=UPI003FD21B3E